MQQIPLGSQGLVTSTLGLGCMGMSAFYGGATEAGSIETIRRALDLGITLFDTAEAYGPFENEKLLDRTLGVDRDRVVVASKFDIDFTDEGTSIGLDGSPEHARRAIDRSLTRLGTDHVDLWYLHRADPNVPIEDTIGAMSEAVTPGKARYIGVSETSAETLRQAHATFPITAIQSEYSLFERDAEHNDVLDTARELGIGFVPFSPLGRGFFSGTLTKRDDLPEGDARRNLPRFSADAIDANLRVVEGLQALADEKGVTTAQLALAWLVQAGTVPIPGTTKASRVAENAAAADVALTANDLERIEAASPHGIALGTRNTEAGMARDRG
ncbi:aldo/keto reductase [Frigoribacterium sp. VKM Ac-2530]|uniref:aldo/keto reductase n=1 Tax=Frigoribacterium sp. VKM Ac-2530 TaxID=2783822 RepID=UPI00188BE980|nr:aldo/keto reductase [Frigoribacterium sp. VKM Ac-2530]MBF4578179.1 aldo/keto reductase [Frigoribacterium sp. VKM Ac-2530]